jgi:hypothetical protein
MKRFILTGAPGAGKTAIIRQIELDGFSVVEEAATDIMLWSTRAASLNRGSIPRSSIRLLNYKNGGSCERRTSRARSSFMTGRESRIRGCHQRSLGSPFNPVSEIIAELQAVATWSGEHRNSPRRRGDWQKDNHANAAIALYTASFRPCECEIAIEGVGNA